MWNCESSLNTRIPRFMLNQNPVSSSDTTNTHIILWDDFFHSSIFYILRSTTFPNNSNHNMIVRPGNESSCSPASFSSASAVGVSHGWKNQQGVPKVGCSPWDNKGNNCPRCWSEKVVLSVLGNALALSNGELRISPRGRGEPPGETGYI